ncbi:MAG: glycosyltransferase family 4 protein [Alphaproteobacteria bacterium]|nr:glycosyltransferase family 4 protein [Alphaproteobacteria bacterium]
MPFRQGDTYLSIGLDWDDKCQGRIDALKSQYGLHIARMCYDLIPIKFPHLAHPSAVRAMSEGYLEKLCISADVVFCISNRTRSDLAAHLESNGVAMPRLEVVELGGELISKRNGSLPEALLDATFILYVSTIERRKNHAVIIKAYRDLIDRNLSAALPQLVFVGMRGWGVSDLMHDIGNDPQMAERVLFLSDLEDDALAALYNACLFTVFPSHYEGWGLGISESLAHGKFCIASNAGALTEAGKDLVDYVDPLDWQQWSNLLLHHIQDRNGLEQRQRDISARYRPMPWSECARQIFSLTDDARSAISAKHTPTGRT